MPAPLMSKEEVITRLLAAFRKHGYEGTSLSILSKEVGLGKASLYHYFPGGKKEMAQAVLIYVTEWLDKNLVLPVTRPGTPEEKLSRLVLSLNTFYAEGRESCVMDIFSMGEAGAMFREGLAPRMLELEKLVYNILLSAGIDDSAAAHRAESAIIQVQGALVVSRVKGNNEPFLKTLSALPSQLLSQA